MDRMPVEVLQENWDAVQIYQRCQPQYATGATGAVYLGIGTQEITGVAAALGLPMTPYVLDAVQFLGYRIHELKRT